MTAAGPKIRHYRRLHADRECVRACKAFYFDPKKHAKRETKYFESGPL